ncbi:type I DNA topoisomerase [Algicola sagamiensis]|uniref:type I DNA topoisomerase n=1 Tax=Algicola sagamiensis TaxID=163869 RepID=UPI000376600E|nr:type I DNA topoisomerase [Algicola sagamiensis]
MKLMIVESPAKVKKIKSFLSNDWIVKASVGHIRDLPESEMGFTPPDFKPVYEVYSEKKKVVSDLKKASKQAYEIFLATDNDREGEAIAFHLMSELKLKKPKRITFNELTKSAIQTAISKPREIDFQLVRAYEGRRILDRIIGYCVSPVLTKKSHVNLSAGRVQSVCLKIIVLREQEIEDFIPRKFYDISIQLENGIKASLNIEPWSSEKHIFDKSQLEQILNIKEVIVSEVSITEKKEHPKAPFISSSIQQSASRLYGFTPKKTMDILQQLHDLGAITYHRTDNPNLSEDGYTMMVKYLQSKEIPHSTEQKKYKSKSSAQEAHEAIRPTDVNTESINSTDDVQKIYALIRERAIASAMPAAIDVITTIKFQSVQEVSNSNYSGYAEFNAKANIEKEKAWRDFVSIEKKNKSDIHLPVIPSNDDSFACETLLEEKTTKSPSRYTEAELVNSLEKLGIGRPSTYASILENIKSRKYVEVKKMGGREGVISPSELGKTLISAIKRMSFMNIKYTEIVEEYLDKISNGHGSYVDLAASVFETVNKEVKNIHIPVLLETKECPLCSQPIKRVISKKKSAFWVHLNDIHEGECEKYIQDQSGNPVIQKTQICPQCAGDIKQISTNSGQVLWVHSNEDNLEDCFKFIPDHDGTPHIPEVRQCDICSTQIHRQRSKDGSKWYWTHTTTKDCLQFINDVDGSPDFK